MTLRCCALEALGTVWIAERDGALVAVHLVSGEPGDDRDAFAAGFANRDEDVVWSQGRSSPARRQLAQYFAGRRREFDLRLAPHGTPFQQRVWHELCRIPYGKTCSYSDIARRIGRPSAARAVGAANGSNPIAIVVPCHRVVGRDGALTGYAGGLDKKRRLLELERVYLPLSATRSG